MDDDPDPNAGKEQWPDDIGETTQGHPEKDDTDIIDDSDPIARPIDYPADIDETTQGHLEEDGMEDLVIRDDGTAAASNEQHLGR